MEGGSECGHTCTDMVKQDISFVSFSIGMLRLHAYCMFTSLNISQHSSIALASVVYVAVPLDISCK